MHDLHNPKKKPISNYASELKLIFNFNLNSNNNDDKNNDSSSIQNGNENNNNSDSNSNSKQYIMLPDFSKKQELKWFSDNNEDIMLEHTHNTDTEFDLRYPEKETIKLELHSCTCINLKIVLKIPPIIMVQLASRNSLRKKRINIKREIINAKYVGNIIAILQNNLEKTYIIKPNKKIA
ncbi:hypothetical protein G9A89_013063 [Geosiphon pyriformis]|nr:hypothetical protein G9A89_013063 [Geosiphon pyriformis]